MHQDRLETRNYPRSKRLRKVKKLFLAMDESGVLTTMMGVRMRLYPWLD